MAAKQRLDSIMENVYNYRILLASQGWGERDNIYSQKYCYATPTPRSYERMPHVRHEFKLSLTQASSQI